MNRRQNTHHGLRDHESPCPFGRSGQKSGEVGQFIAYGPHLCSIDSDDFLSDSGDAGLCGGDDALPVLVRLFVGHHGPNIP